MAKKTSNEKVTDLTTRILQKIHGELAAIRRQTKAVPQIGKDVAEMASRFGLRRVEELLGRQ
ncbi:MAG: hypothetical protein ACOZIN_14550 [Myxococcota bacterium]